MSTPTTAPTTAAPTTGAAPNTKSHPSASLYVGDLDRDVTEAMLFEIFNQVGPVASIRVCRDAKLRRSLGYAYVNFHNAVDAERALDTLNNTPIKGRICRIMWSQRDPSLRKSGVGNVFIKNLDPQITHKELHDTFSIFGNILSCKVVMDENGNSLGYGFVHFEGQESAEKAITKVNGMMVGSKKVFVAAFVPKKERQKQKEASWTNVFVKDLDGEMTREGLTDMFKDFGEVTSIFVTTDSKGRQFGFINFKNHEDAVRSVNEMNGKKVNNKPLYVGRAQKKSERESELRRKYEQLKLEHLAKYTGINLYIKNLEDEVNEEVLRKEFGNYGKIKTVRIMTDEKGVTKGFGFVCFTTPEEAQRALAEMNGRILPGCKKPLYVNLHEPKEQRRLKLMQQHAARARGMRPNMPGAPAMGYPGGPGMFYPPGAMPQGFVPYPGQPGMMPRSRWGAQGYPMPNYAMGPGGVMPPQGQMGGQRGGRGGRGGMGQRGGRPNVGGPRGPRDNQGQQPQGQPQGQPAPYATVVAADKPQQPQAQATPAPANEQTLTAAQLASYSPEQQRVMLGERLYALVLKHLEKANENTQLAGKITGMLLDSDQVEGLIQLLGDETALSQQIDDGLNLLKEHQTAETQAQ